MNFHISGYMSDSGSVNHQLFTLCAIYDRAAPPFIIKRKRFSTVLARHLPFPIEYSMCA